MFIPVIRLNKLAPFLLLYVNISTCFQNFKVRIKTTFEKKKIICEPISAIFQQVSIQLTEQGFILTTFLLRKEINVVINKNSCSINLLGMK